MNLLLEQSTNDDQAELKLTFLRQRDRPRDKGDTILMAKCLSASANFKFTGYCIRMPSGEPDNCFVIYESKIRSSLRLGALRATYLNQISSRILLVEKTLEAMMMIEID